MEDELKRVYAEVIRQLAPLDDDLFGCGAPKEAIQGIRQVFAVCESDFRRRYGEGYQKF